MTRSSRVSPDSPVDEPVDLELARIALRRRFEEIDPASPAAHDTETTLGAATQSQ